MLYQTRSTVSSLSKIIQHISFKLGDPGYFNITYLKEKYWNNFLDLSGYQKKLRPSFYRCTRWFYTNDNDKIFIINDFSVVFPSNKSCLDSTIQYFFLSIAYDSASRTSYSVSPSISALRTFFLNWRKEIFVIKLYSI